MFPLIRIGRSDVVNFYSIRHIEGFTDGTCKIYYMFHGDAINIKKPIAEVLQIIEEAIKNIPPEVLVKKPGGFEVY